MPPAGACGAIPNPYRGGGIMVDEYDILTAVGQQSAAPFLLYASSAQDVRLILILQTVSEW